MQLLKDVLLAWADGQRDQAQARVRKKLDAKTEAEDFVVELATRGYCVHARRDELRWVYCDDCPIGQLTGGLSPEASKRLCSRTRQYSK